MHKPLPSIETLISRNAKEGIFTSRTKRIDFNYNLIEFLSGRRSSSDTVVNVATVEVGAVVLIEKLVFNVTYEKISVYCSRVPKKLYHCVLSFNFTLI